jgi:hypothetical protein
LLGRDLLLQNNLACLEITRLIGAGISFAQVAHTIFVHGARAFGTNTQSLAASKVDGLRLIFLSIAKIKLELEACIWIISIIFRNFT